MDNAFLAFVQAVEEQRRELRCSNSGAFFRGHSRSSYRLVPSLLRADLPYEVEHNLYHECFARAGALVSRDATSWERLAFLQHYGIPTRLLDWTESFGIALFFAVHGDVHEPQLWIANAFNMNRSIEQVRRSRIMLAGLDAIPDYHETFIRVEDRKPWPFEKPLFLSIPWGTDRLRAQGGFFTFHPDATPLDVAHEKYVRAVTIPPDALNGARQFLAHAGITEYTVFPDFVGFAAFIRKRYGL